MWWLTQRLIEIRKPYVIGRSTSQNRIVLRSRPIVPQLGKFGKMFDRDHRLLRHGGARVHQHFVGGEIGRVIT